MKQNNKNAVMLTGAAARIAQEVACIDKLIERNGLKITEEDTILTGFSSGSLNLVALNACFRTNNPLDWEKDYKQDMLWSLTNDKVYKKGGVFGAVFDTAPLRETLDAFLTKAGFTNFRDLPFDSFVMTFSDRHLKTEWASTFGEKNQGDLVASDLFMASTAIPIAFPAQKIAVASGGERNFVNGHFSDGGTGGQFKHFEDYLGAYVLKNGAFKSLNIISPMRESGTAELENLQTGKHKESFLKHEEEKLKQFTTDISFKAFLKFLNAIKTWENTNGPIADQVLINIPRLANNFGILDFNQEQAEYNAVCDWVDQNPTDFAVPIDEFLAKHQVV